MSLLLMLMRRKGMRDRIRMVNEGVAAALAVAGGTADIPLGSAAFDFWRSFRSGTFRWRG